MDRSNSMISAFHIYTSFEYELIINIYRIKVQVLKPLHPLLLMIHYVGRYKLASSYEHLHGLKSINFWERFCTYIGLFIKFAKLFQRCLYDINLIRT